MPVAAENVLGALRHLLNGAHTSVPDDLARLVTESAVLLGAVRASMLIVDYDQVVLVPFAPSSPGDLPTPGRVPIEGTLAGRSFVDVAQLTGGGPDAASLWTPMLDGTDRLGVLHLEFAAGTEIDDTLRQAAVDLAGLVAEIIATRSVYGDSVQRTRRSQPMTVPAELQWTLLPPLTFISPRVAVAGVVAPTSEVAGDSFDYALNGDVLSVAIFDAMGHGTEAALLAALAVSTYRNARRTGLSVDDTARAIDESLSTQFGVDKFVTGIIGQLDVSTGWWTWVTCGHPPALLVRGSKVVKMLDQVVGPPLGLTLLDEGPIVGQERLEPGDRLLLYTDGVVEARNADGEFFGSERLVGFVSREEGAGRPAAETMRRLNHAILGHQEGSLQDDATTVMIEWLTEQPRTSTP